MLSAALPEIACGAPVPGRCGLCGVAPWWIGFASLSGFGLQKAALIVEGEQAS